MLILELCALLKERGRDRLSYLSALWLLIIVRYTNTLTYLLSFSNINCVSKKPANILAVSRASKHIFDRVLSRHKANMETQKSLVGRLLSRYAIHEKELFKRFRLDTRKFVFSNRVVHNWNSLSAQCVNSCTINTFKKHVSVWLEPESSYHLEVWYVESRRYRH